MDQNILESWSKTQEHGELVYEKFPHLNCSTDGRNDVKEYKKFCDFKGNVLDIGSGLVMPSYLMDNDKIKLGIGIDPLVKESYKGSKLYLLKAIGEFIPFQDKYFDSVSFATSFDHVINHKETILECLRTLKENAELVFWVNTEQEDQSILNKGLNKLRSKLSKKKNDDSIQLQASVIDSMEIPPGAVDKFHLIHITDKGLKEMLKDFPLKLISEKKIIGSTFLKYQKHE